METERRFEDDYELLDTVLGVGMNGPVRIARNKKTGIEVATKFLLKSVAADNEESVSAALQFLVYLSQLKLFRQEAGVYLRLDHPNVAKLVAVYEGRRKLVLVMEKCLGGELHDYVRNAYSNSRHGIPEQTVVAIALQMTSACAYLHSHHVAHRDIKLENFLIERPMTDDVLVREDPRCNPGRSPSDQVNRFRLGEVLATHGSVHGKAMRITEPHCTRALEGRGLRQQG